MAGPGPARNTREPGPSWTPPPRSRSPENRPSVAGRRDDARAKTRPGAATPGPAGVPPPGGRRVRGPPRLAAPRPPVAWRKCPPPGFSAPAPQQTQRARPTPQDRKSPHRLAIRRAPRASAPCPHGDANRAPQRTGRSLGERPGCRDPVPSKRRDAESTKRPFGFGTCAFLHTLSKIYLFAPQQNAAIIN